MEKSLMINAKSDFTVVCPKPRRIGVLSTIINDQKNCAITEVADCKATSELFDLILNKGENSTNQVASSPPFFSGSPPSRVSNPIIEDSRFGCDGASPLFPDVCNAKSPSSPGNRGGSCIHVKYGNNPAAVRIEGFICLSPDCRSVSAVA